MKILIAGINGYMGTALYKHLKDKHEVFGFDNNLREKAVLEVGGRSITPKKEIPYDYLDAKNYDMLKRYIEDKKPDAIVWLAEQPSAPYSHIDAKHAKATIENNQLGSINVLYTIKEVNPDIHLIKLGTEGEYPDWLWNGKHIPEGNRVKVRLLNKVGEMDDIPIEVRVDDWEIPTPRYFGSWYHFTKFSESYMMDYANRIWGLNITDINQGIIYGHRHGTRLDVDEFFGTLVHRFIAQAVTGNPLTVYGEGGQTRGMICLQNSLEAIELLIDNPAKGLRVLHQTGFEYSVNQVAEMIKDHIDCEIKHIENPRPEMPRNHFTFDTSTLDKLGLKKISLEEELPRLIKTVQENKERIIINDQFTKW
jgi:nucleoside-diphosphate-sugar epimerase